MCSYILYRTRKSQEVRVFFGCGIAGQSQGVSGRMATSLKVDAPLEIAYTFFIPSIEFILPNPSPRRRMNNRNSNDKVRHDIVMMLLEAAYAAAPVRLCFIDSGLSYVLINTNLAEID
jgi:hypothetical protein